MVDALLVTRIFAPEPAAASYRLAAFADAWVTAGGSIRVITTRTASSHPEVIPPYAISRWRVKRAADGAVRGYLSYMSFDVPAFFRALVAQRPDVIVAEPPPTTGLVIAAVAWMRRVPFVYYAADCWSDAAAATNAPRAVVSVVRVFERFAMRRAAAVLTVNAVIARRLREIEPAARVDDIGNGVDTTVFTERGPVAAVAGPTVVYTGTASEWQGAEIFIEAWTQVLSRIPEARLRFVGSGSSWLQLQRRAQELVLEDSIEFVDTVPPDEAAAHLRAASVAVVSLKPGLSYDYALPTKLLAALACGTPSIYVGEGVGAQFAETVSRENSGLSRSVSFDPSEVASALIHLLSVEITPAERSRLAAWAREKVSLAAVAQRATSVVTRVARLSS